MNLTITGDERDVANSAWVSTLNEARAKIRSNDDVKRVVEFLVKNHHTSPFESVTVNFEFGPDDMTLDGHLFLADYENCEYARFDLNEYTIDLLNFVKVTSINDLWEEELWLEFKKVRPELADLCEFFGPLVYVPAEDVFEELGDDNNMNVELIHLHKGFNQRHSRATWRVRCPLSIAVQILRHRTGSYNMVSGRYRTIKQEIYSTPDDCQRIVDKFGENMDSFLKLSEKMTKEYLEFMLKAKQAKDDGVISNNEYKRVREVSRFILPEGRMTELYITYYLDDFYGNYVKLRNSEHAQTEHIWIAQQMEESLEEFSYSNS